MGMNGIHEDANHKTCILDFWEKMDSLPMQDSNRGYSPVQLICSL